ncbi:MAG TPA: CHAT domain-containing protein [Herpetosiphonaceae bacterium]
MFDEREFIAKFEKANIEDLTDILRQPDPNQDRALRSYLGTEQYRRLRSLALRCRVSRARHDPWGNVVVIHCFMGSALSAMNSQGTYEQIWVNARQLMDGKFESLRLREDGRNEFNAQDEIRVTGMLKRYYGDLLLSLSEHWNVWGFWYDWRKSVRTAAAQLEALVNEWFSENEPFHIVAHGLGGVVARTFVRHAPERWATMRDTVTDMRAGGRLIMLGSPNYGSFVIPQVLTGLSHLVGELDEIDLRHNRNEILNIVHSFTGLYQMLPSPFIERGADQLYRPGDLAAPNQDLDQLYQAVTYDNLHRSLQVSQHYLDAARQIHKTLHPVVDPERMISIVGDTHITAQHITNIQRIDMEDAYQVSKQGDGFVTYDLSRLSPDSAFPTYYVDEPHGNLTTHPKVLGALHDLLTNGKTEVLATRPLSGQNTTDSPSVQVFHRQTQQGQETLQNMLRSIKARTGNADGSEYWAAEERKIENFLTRDILCYREEEQVSKPKVDFDTRIEIGLVHGNIVDIDTVVTNSVPIDALGVGHYKNVRPYSALLDLDKALYHALNHDQRAAAGERARQHDYPLTQFIERGIISGDLGQPFFLPDPRHVPSAGESQRIIAIAGMGQTGRFGAPELAVLAREICWALGRLGKHHLATVMIGAGTGNIPVRKAVDSWIRGIKAAVTGSTDDKDHRLRRITFVEKDPRRMAEVDRAIQEQQQRLRRDDRLIISYTPLSDEAIQSFEELGQKEDFQEWQRERQRRRDPLSRRIQIQEDNPDTPPTRVTLWLDNDTYRFGAITETATIPEREVPLDPKLVLTANDELMKQYDLTQQSERGQFMANLLLPDDLREHMFTNAPLVMILDRTTARIHWEMLTYTDFEPDVAEADAQRTQFEDVFLGTSRGLTRQFRTILAPPRDAPPPPRRLLRVLVIADPAADMRLPGAEEEGAAVADLFEAFNSVYETTSESRVEVVRLFGPYEATRTAVLRNMMERSFNLVHFAGHCTYDRADPAASGWIFTGGERLSAREINRIDRVPSFVFSNACESGVTPDASEGRNAELAPSFAESFFARGVANFVCTAWPVADLAARDFALTLYASMLGIKRDADGRYLPTASPEPMHIAMRAARCEIAQKLYGVRTWGAYQHYGNPHFRLFDANALSSRLTSSAPEAQDTPTTS